jgi:hypothetical protein
MVEIDVPNISFGNTDRCMVSRGYLRDEPGTVLYLRPSALEHTKVHRIVSLACLGS